MGRRSWEGEPMAPLGRQRYINDRSGLKGRIDFSVGNAENWIENAPPGAGS